MNIIDKIAEEIMSDDTDHDRESERLRDFLDGLDLKEREAVNTFVSYLTGWELQTLVDKYGIIG